VDDGYEKNSAPDASAVFKPRIGLLYSNRLPLNSARELASPNAAEKTPATGGTARKELTLLARTLNLKPPLRLVLGRIMSPESCQHTRPSQTLKRVLTQS
jgi:hypothetical protein